MKNGEPVQSLRPDAKDYWNLILPQNLERYFLDNGWTDYLPIILPTEERVAEMLKGTSHKPDEIIGKMQPIPPHDAWERSVGQLGAGARTGTGNKAVTGHDATIASP